MSGATVTPVPSNILAGVDTFASQTPSASSANWQRFAAVIERLDTLLRIGHPIPGEMSIFQQQCLNLARCIDFAIANYEAPKAEQLPLLLKKICQCRNVHALQAVIMVLMISVKNACKFKWFSDKDAEELLTHANEIGSNFSIPGDVNTEPDHYLPTVSKIMARFYPQMKMGKILASLEVKPGYGAFFVDFHILKDGISFPQEKIYLFVAQKDDIEMSSCITSPPQVSFLLNGKGVEKRTNVLMDSGPQLPTNVTTMLKYGTNMLQVVGQFNGHYIIAIAFMSVTSCLDTSVLQDFIQPVVAAPDSDSEIIEGPSRISLSCPISRLRIKTPVKGHSCKHLQCFDFKNFMEINSKRPYWRCPHCNQSICYPDIRVDQNMVKVLREVGENVLDVTISADGSWKVVSESNDHIDQPPHDVGLGCQPKGSTVMDLTEGYDEMDVVIPELEDRKPSKADLQIHSVATNQTMPSPATQNTSEAHQNTAPQVEDDFWSGVYLSTYGSVAPVARSDLQIVGGPNSMTSPVLTDAVSPALNRAPETSHLTTSFIQSQFSSPHNMQLQQALFGDSMVSNEYGRLPLRPINRTPVAIQALPAMTPSPQQRSRSNSNPFLPNVSSIASQVSSSPDNMGRQHQLTRSAMNPLQLSEITPLQYQGGLPVPNQLQNSYRQSSSSGFPVNQRVNQNIGQSPNLLRQSIQLPWTSVQQSATQIQRGSRTGLGPSYSVNADKVQTPAGRVQTVSRADDLLDLSIQQNWQPVGRMRGSLTGRAYSAALEQYIIQPTQPRPPSNPTSAPSQI